MEQEPNWNTATVVHPVGCGRSGEWQDGYREPSLEDLLSDPMVRLLMRRDRLVADEVEDLLRSAARRLAHRGQAAKPMAKLA